MERPAYVCLVLYHTYPELPWELRKRIMKKAYENYTGWKWYPVRDNITEKLMKKYQNKSRKWANGF